MLQRIYRQRRRLMLVALLAALHGGLALWYGMTGAVQAAGWVAAAVFFSVVVVIWLPVNRAVLEKLSLGALVGLGAAALAGWTGWASALLEGGVTIAVAFVWMLAEPWLMTALGTARGAVFTGHARIALSPEDALQGFCLGPGARQWNPMIAQVTAGTDGAIVQHYRSDGGMTGAIARHRLLEEGPRHIIVESRYEGVGMGIDNQPAVTRVEVAGRGRTTLISAAETLDCVPRYPALRSWLDDMMGDYLDQYAAISEGRPDLSFRGADADLVRRLTAMDRGG